MKQIRRIPPPTITALVAALQLSVVAPGTATPASQEEVTELIVRLAPYPAAPRPEDVVAAGRLGTPLPAGLDVGAPMSVRLAIRERPTGPTLDWILNNPDTPLARLQRYLVLQYEPGSDLNAIMDALAANSEVIESVEKNLYFRLSLTPSDPLVGSQWGIDSVNLRPAWDYTHGWGYLGFIDTGLEVEHPELRAFHRDEQDQLVYDGGGLRTQLGFDYLYNNCGIDELDPEDGVLRTRAGHGTVVAGIAAARRNSRLLA